jgi:hypothetical protein
VRALDRAQHLEIAMARIQVRRPMVRLNHDDAALAPYLQRYRAARLAPRHPSSSFG